MKIGLIYVGHGQEDEQSILQNNRGSERYNAFVNSLGWEIDIATHTGYLGGLERNLTNGTRAAYYCSSTIEMIFHDVTKMPTDTSDPKQLKKVRTIENFDAISSLFLLYIRNVILVMIMYILFGMNMIEIIVLIQLVVILVMHKLLLHPYQIIYIQFKYTVIPR